MPGFTGTATLHLDDDEVDAREITTQPEMFCPGEGICVGRDSAPPVTGEYTSRFRFTGGTIDKVIVDVPGEPFVDPDKMVAAWFAQD